MISLLFNIPLTTIRIDCVAFFNVQSHTDTRKAMSLQYMHADACVLGSRRSEWTFPFGAAARLNFLGCHWLIAAIQRPRLGPDDAAGA